MTGRSHSLFRPWLWAALVLTLTKLWLTRGQSVFAIGSAGYDDRLFLELARHLLHGEWLGPYDELTLAKGPFYPLFIAVAHLFQVPLFLAQHLFYTAACALFVWALRPAIQSAAARFAIYALLLLNPMSWDAGTMGRVLRQHVYGPLALLIFAGLAALYLRRKESIRPQAPWAVLLGLASAAFYLTREESIWLLPSVLLLIATILWGSWQLGLDTLKRTGAMLGLAAVVTAIPLLFVCTENLLHYRWFGTCEFRASAFQDAYGAMLRVHVGPDLPYVPVTRQARVAMAAVSPTFARVQHELDQGVARGWAGASEFFTGLPPAQEQIAGGWMMWALREAAFRATKARDAHEVMMFYRQMADEINQACTQGRLPAGPRRSGFAPPWRDYEADPFVSAAEQFAVFVITFDRFTAIPSPSTGTGQELKLFRDFTNERLSPPAPAVPHWRARTLQALGEFMRILCRYLSMFSLLGFVISIAVATVRRVYPFPLTLAAAAIGACAASLLIHAMIQATSFPVLTISSFAPIYPLLLIFVVATGWTLAVIWRVPARKQEEISSQSVPPSIFRYLPWLVGLVAMVPFLIWQREFRKLFWFGDDLFLIDQMAAMGFHNWIGHVFSENFVPLFKWLWGGSVLVFNGSYLVMLWLLWLTHGLNTALLARLLQRTGFPVIAILIVTLVFGLTPANLETLGWSVQWSAVLATTFLFLGLLWHEQRSSTTGKPDWKDAAMLALFAAASACSFSRGVLTGGIFALAWMLPLSRYRAIKAWLARLPGAFVCLFPAVTVALVIFIYSRGNQQHMSGHWGDAVKFGASFFLFNPFCVLSGLPLQPTALLLIAGAKLGIIALALHVARGKVRTLLFLLLIFDFGNATLLGIGRYHTGFIASLSSRYQYGSLIATLPALGLLCAWLLDRLSRIFRLRPAITIVVTISLIWFGLRGWPAALRDFTNWRGTALRQQMAAPITKDPNEKVPTLDFMHIERAKALMRAYNLH